MASALALRLKRLEAIRTVAEQLSWSAQLGRDVFLAVSRSPSRTSNIRNGRRPSMIFFPLMPSNANERAFPREVAQRTVWSLAQAREALERLIGQSADWARLDEYLLTFVIDPALARTVFASSFASTLELVREGVMEVHQQAAFAPLYVRKNQQTNEREGLTAGPRC